MTTGTVKWFNDTKGYGFIAPDEGGNDVFVHISAVQGSGLSGLNEGDKIEYELEVDSARGKTSASPTIAPNMKQLFYICVFLMLCQKHHKKVTSTTKKT